jgi:hypothetical protein
MRAITPSRQTRPPADERLAGAVPIADLVTVARKRAAGKPVVKMS